MPALSEASEASHWATETRSRKGSRATAILPVYVALCCLSLVPFIAIAQPPIVDFANHAARLTLACIRTDPTVAAMYRYQLGIIPNLAIDLVNAPLCGIVTPSMVLRLVTASSLSLIYFSGWLIQRKLFGAANAFLFVLPAIAFNLVTTMGYMNFLAGVAVTCLLVALAIGNEGRFRRLVLLCNLGGLVVFFCHIFALGFALLIFFGLMLRGRPFSAKGIVAAACRTMALFAVPLVLILFVPTGHEPFAMGFFHKTRMLPALFMAQHASLGIYGLALLAPLYLLLRNKVVDVDKRMRLPLLIGAAFVLVCPSSFHDAVDIDSRLLVGLAYLFFASLTPRRREGELTLALGSVAIGLVAFQLWSGAEIWIPFSKRVEELRQASSVLPPKAKLFTVVSDGPDMLVDPLAYSHLSSYLTVERRVFNPLDFTGVGMQPLSVTPAFAAVDTPTGQPYSPNIANRFITPDPALAKLARENGAGFALGWPRKFDYVIVYHMGQPYNFNPPLLTEIKRGSFFSIYKVKSPT
jgi:hypothetical protein